MTQAAYPLGTNNSMMMYMVMCVLIIIQVGSVVIPRPPTDGTAMTTAVGKIFVEFSSVTEAETASRALSGRQFASRTVVTTFYDESKFASSQLE